MRCNRVCSPWSSVLEAARRFSISEIAWSRRSGVVLVSSDVSPSQFDRNKPTGRRVFSSPHASSSCACCKPWLVERSAPEKLTPWSCEPLKFVSFSRALVKSEFVKMERERSARDKFASTNFELGRLASVSVASSNSARSMVTPLPLTRYIRALLKFAPERSEPSSVPPERLEFLKRLLVKLALFNRTPFKALFERSQPEQEPALICMRASTLICAEAVEARARTGSRPNMRV